MLEQEKAWKQKNGLKSTLIVFFAVTSITSCASSSSFFGDRVDRVPVVVAVGTTQGKTADKDHYFFCDDSFLGQFTFPCPVVSPKTPYKKIEVSSSGQITSDQVAEFFDPSIAEKEQASRKPLNKQDTKLALADVEPPLNTSSIKPPHKTDLVVPIRVYFGFAKSNLDNAARLSLSKIPALAQDSLLEIVGYTDNIGSKVFNSILALNRANAVKFYLVSKGFSAERIEVSGKGLCCYLNDNVTEEQRSMNRRAELSVIIKQ